MAVTRIKNNQITDATITYTKIATGTITGDRMNPNLTFNSNLVLNGNLTVTGNVTAVESTITQISDPLLTLALGNGGTSYDLGLILTRGSGGNRFLGWKENEAAFVFIDTTEDGLTSGNISTTAYSNVIVGNLVSLSGATFGNVIISNNNIDTTQGTLTISSAGDLITLSNSVSALAPVVLSSTLAVDGTATVNALVSNTTGQFGTDVIVGDELSVVGVATVNSLVSNGSIAGTTINGSGTATVESLSVNTTGQFGTSLTADGGIQNTPIGNATANTGKFTTIESTGASTLDSLEVNNSVTVGANLTVTGAASVGSLDVDSIGTTDLTVNGNATVAALTTTNSFVSNTTVDVGTDLTVGNDLTVTGTTTTEDLVSNTTAAIGTSATIGTTLSVAGTATVNALASNTTGQFGTDVVIGDELSVVGAATVNSLVSNTTGQFSTDVSVGNDLTVAGTTTTEDLVSNTTAAIGTSATVGTTLSVAGTATVNALVSNTTGQFGTNVIVGDELSVVGVATVNSLVSNGSVQGTSAQFTTINGSGTATVNALVSNTTGQFGTTLAVGTDLTVNGTTTTEDLVVNSNVTFGDGTVLGNLLVEGNLRVMGNLSYINVDEFVVQDPIIQLNTGPNGAPLSVDNGFDVGIRAHYYDTADRSAFFGRQDTSGFFEYYSNVTSESGNVITGTLGTIRAGSLQSTGDVSVGTTLSVAGTATVNALTSNTSIGVATDLTVGNNLTVAGTTTTEDLVSNTTAAIGTSATIGTTLSVADTATVNALTSNTTGQFGTDVVIGDELSVVGAATVNSLVSNTTGQFATDVSIGNDLTVAGTTTTEDLVSNTTAAIGTSATVGTTLNVADTATVNALTSNTTGQFGTDVVIGDELSVVGAATVNSLVSNTTGQFSTDVVVGNDLSVVGTATVDDLAVNTSAVVATFASVGTDLTVGGNITGGNLIANNALFVSSISTTGDIITTGGNIRANAGEISAVSGVFSGDVQISGNLNVNVNVTATSSGVFYGNATTGINALYAGIPSGYSVLPNVVAQFTTNTNHYAQINTQNLSSGTEASSDFVATADDGDDSNYYVDLGIGSSTYDYAAYPAYGPHDSYLLNNGGNLIINNDTAGKAINFIVGGTDVTENVATMFETKLQVTQATTSTSFDTGALVVDGGVGIAGNLNVSGTGISNIGNVQISTNTITAVTTNGNINLNANGTGDITLNSSANNSRTVINGTTADVFVVDGTQVGIGSSTFTAEATFQVHATDSMLIPFGTTGERPASPSTGMLRFNTSSNNLEWYDGAGWDAPTGDFTVIVANSQTGNGSVTTFTLPVANATTAGTIISINGIVQEPVTAYSITGNVVTFTEPPLSTDTIDFRILTTTAQVTSVTDTAGTTGIFMDEPTVGSDIVTFKINSSTSLKVEANAQITTYGNIIPNANVTYNLGSSSARFNTVYAQATSALYADVAEKYVSDADYEPGTVVEFGGEFEVTVCAHDMCRRVAGVVSTAPAYLMNDGLNADHTVAVALTGRVPCCVTGTVRKGDLMVSAGNGAARAEADPVVGSVIGKALENFDGTSGVIEVVVGRF